MTEVVDSALAFTDIVPRSSLVGRLREQERETWESYVDHDFVRQLAAGTLPRKCFQHYLVQDYLFLIQYARAYSLAAYKSGKLSEMRHYSAVAQAIVGTEMGLHVDYCAEWGISELEMLAAPEATATIAYTRYVLEMGNGGDILDLHTALIPCMVGYAEIANRITASSDTVLEGNPYKPWIEMYASDEFQDLAKSEIELFDRIGEARLGGDRFEELCETFRRASRLEAQFWDMGLTLDH